MPNVALKHALSVRSVQQWSGTGSDGQACGPVLRWAGNDYPCSASGEVWSQDLERGGFNPQTIRSLVVLESLFTGSARPEPKQVCTVTPAPGMAAIPYRITTSNLLAGATLRRLTLVSPQGGA